MFETLATLFGWAWLAWCVGNALVLLCVPLFYRPQRNAYTNGFVVVIGPYLEILLSPAELVAIVAHERGHIAHRHNFRNLARAFVFLRTGPARKLRQEYEADDYAAARGHGPALASALRRMAPFSSEDRARAKRLEA